MTAPARISQADMERATKAVKAAGFDRARNNYPTKAKVEHAIRMARLAGIETIGSIELAPDGTIRIAAATPGASTSGAPSVEDEIAQWRDRKRGRQ